MKMRSAALRIGLGLFMFVTPCLGGQTLATPGQMQGEPTYTPLPTVIEPGLAYGDPCKPPCWRGIVPGQSSRQEVMQAIEELRATGWASYIGGGPVGGYYIEPGSILVTIENDVVRKISGQITFYYSVDTMIEQFGEPGGVYVIKGGTSKGSCEEWIPPDPPSASVMSDPVYVLYPEKGLAFLVLVPLSGLGLICPEMKVTAFCYHSPIAMQEALKNDYLASLCPIVPKHSDKVDLVEWHGYGSGY